MNAILLTYFGATYRGMLLPLLQSIERACPKCVVHMLYYDVPPSVLELPKVFPQLRCIPVAPAQIEAGALAAAKPLLICEHLASLPGVKKALILDADMLVVRDPFGQIRDTDDVVFTTREGPWPINGGVLGMVDPARPAMREFFREWSVRTTAICREPELLRQARSKRHPYGHADQMAFAQLIAFQLGREGLHWTASDGRRLAFRAVDCALLNETRSRAVGEDTHIVHYKGGWHPILLKGQAFSPYRPRRKSWLMFRLYWREFVAARQRVRMTIPGESWGMQPPAWYSTGDERLLRTVYLQHALRDRALFWAQRFRNVLATSWRSVVKRGN